MDVRAEQTPNPNAMKFTMTTPLFTDHESHNFKKGESSDLPIINTLLALDGVDNVFGYQDFITVNKQSDISWDDLLPHIEKIFDAY